MTNIATIVQLFAKLVWNRVVVEPSLQEADPTISVPAQYRFYGEWYLGN